VNTADKFTTDNIILHHNQDDARPFFMTKHGLMVGAPLTSHAEMVRHADIISGRNQMRRDPSKETNYKFFGDEEAIKDALAKTDYFELWPNHTDLVAGRMWTKRRVAVVWNSSIHPKLTEMYEDLLAILASQFRITHIALSGDEDLTPISAAGTRKPSSANQDVSKEAALHMLATKKPVNALAGSLKGAEAAASFGSMAKLNSLIRAESAGFDADAAIRTALLNYNRDGVDFELVSVPELAPYSYYIEPWSTECFTGGGAGECVFPDAPNSSADPEELMDWIKFSGTDKLKAMIERDYGKVVAYAYINDAWLDVELGVSVYIIDASTPAV